jgi:hypothetical protein
MTTDKSELTEEEIKVKASELKSRMCKQAIDDLIKELEKVDDLRLLNASVRRIKLSIKIQ